MAVRRFDIYGQPVDFIDCPEVAEGFRTILAGWDMRELPFEPATPAYVTFRREAGIYDWQAPWIGGRGRREQDPSRDVMQAVCDFHYEFIDWFADRNPGFFCVHMAAVEFAGKAVLFPAVQKAGKSTLALHCVQAASRLLGDDVVAIDPASGEAVALGLMPRMRLPLPVRASPSFRSFMSGRAGLADRCWQYVTLRQAEIVPCHERLPIGGVVVLDRREDVRATLTPAQPSLTLKALIDRNFGLLEHPGRIFDCFRDIVRGTACRRLTYSDPEEAAALLICEFGDAAAGQGEAIHAGA